VLENKIMKNLILVIFAVLYLNASAINPVKDYIYYPDSLGLKYTETKILTSDSTLINTWEIAPLVASENNEKVIILAGTDAGNMSYLLNHAYALSYNGFNVILFDYRGFGESTDFNINREQLYYNEFTLDLSAIILECKTNYPNKKIGVLAFSMGTIMTNSYLENNTLDFVILEGIVSNTNNFIKKIKTLKNLETILPKSADSYDANFNKNLENSHKTIVFHGTKDVFSEIKDIPKSIKIVEFEGEHLQGFYRLSKAYFGDLYIKEIVEFI
jgi:hypothetical protein